MGNPALIPLSGVAPQTPNPIEAYARIMGIKNAQLEQQGLQQDVALKQMQVESMKGLMEAGKDVDWQQPDAFDKFLKNAQSNGVNPMMLNEVALNRQKYLNELAQTDTNTLKAHAEANNQALGYIDGMKGADQPTKQLKARQALQAGVVRDPMMQQFLQATAMGQLNP